MEKDSTTLVQSQPVMSQITSQNVHAYKYQLWEGIAITGIILLMLMGLYMVFKRLQDLGQGFGPNSLKALGIVLFIPALVLLAILTDFRTETLAALLGTVAGYVLSNTEDKANNKTGNATPSNKIKPSHGLDTPMPNG